MVTPYGAYAKRAVLELVTLLNKLCQGWDNSELQMGGCLTQFRREQRIMDLKPKHIKKDLKVFEWGMLASA
jgi:hypothetical protein